MFHVQANPNMTPATPANTNVIGPSFIPNPSAALFFGVVVGANANDDVLVAGRAAGVVNEPLTRVTDTGGGEIPVTRTGPVLVGPAGTEGTTEELATCGDVTVGTGGVIGSPATGVGALLVVSGFIIWSGWVGELGLTLETLDWEKYRRGKR
jgi:hypothetical protein